MPSPTSPQPDPSQIPWRFREAQFRRYEGILKTAVDLFPLTFIINPKVYNLPPSLVTCSARLRDAKISYDRYNWPAVIDREKFLSCREGLIVAEGQGYLITGRIDEVRTHFKAIGLHVKKATSPTSDPSNIYQLKVTRAQFFFLCQLAANNVFSKDLLIEADPVEVFDLKEHAPLAADNYAISLVPEDDQGKTWRLLKG